MATKQRILLVEDEDHLLEAIKLNLELEGYKVTTATDGKKALRIFKEERFNLVILDVMLPEIDGFQVAETIRLENSEVPIMFLTAKNTSEDRVTGLKKGADDYLVKPFNLEELILRVGILVRRSLKGDELKELNSYKIGDKTIYFNSFEVQHDDGTITPLTKKKKPCFLSCLLSVKMKQFPGSRSLKPSGITTCIRQRGLSIILF